MVFAAACFTITLSLLLVRAEDLELHQSELGGMECENRPLSDDHIMEDKCTRTAAIDRDGEGNVMHAQREQCYQLVPYEPVNIIPPFQEPLRRFVFAEKEWVIAQQWDQIGLAAVVWEAVSLA